MIFSVILLPSTLPSIHAGINHWLILSQHSIAKPSLQISIQIEEVSSIKTEFSAPSMTLSAGDLGYPSSEVQVQDLDCAVA